MSVLMSGNEAIARGAFECGVRFAAGYPGTPSTEIMEAFAHYPGVYAEWSPNEKVAMEVGHRRSRGRCEGYGGHEACRRQCGGRPAVYRGYTGTNGALVIITADDPSLHSSAE